MSLVLVALVLEIEPRALNTLGKCSTTELYPSPLCTFLLLDSIALCEYTSVC